VYPPAPEYSLLLRKASAHMPHGGGKKLAEGSLPYRRVRRWIAEGARFGGTVAPVAAIEVEPAHQVLSFRGTQQLRVTALNAVGQRHCVTGEAQYDSNAAAIAGVDARG